MKKILNRLSLIIILFYGVISIGSEFNFTPVKKYTDIGSSISGLKEGQVSFLTYITDGVVREGGDSQYELQDDYFLPIEERKNQPNIKAVRVVHGEYVFWINHQKSSEDVYKEFLSKYNSSNLVQALIPSYKNTENGQLVKTEIYFPCDIVRTFEGVKAFPNSEIATAMNATEFLKEKVNTYFSSNFIADEKMISFNQSIQFGSSDISSGSIKKFIEKSQIKNLGSVTQTLFNFNQIIRWGQIQFHFLSSPKNPNRTLVYINSRLAMRADFMSIGPDKRDGRSSSELDIVLKSPLEDYLMGNSSFFKKSADGKNMTYFENHLNIGDLVSVLDTFIGAKNFIPTPECQQSSGPSILSGIPKFQQVYVEGFANLLRQF